MSFNPAPLFPRRPFPKRAFNQPILIRPADYSTLTAQGGANPAIGASGYAYNASVQALSGRAAWTQQAGGAGGMAGGASMPQAATTFDVIVPYDPDDTVIPALRIGDQIEWRGGILTVQGTANDSGGFGVLWHIRCEQNNS